MEAFSVHRHHHIARAPAHGLAPAHAARLARSLRRQSVGLVLAGGGARGFAHVGVLMALEEEGVPVDLLGGTSMGSFVGGLYAKEPTALLTRIITRRLAVHMSSTWNQLMDLTVPVVSYFSGFRMNKVLEPLFRQIEDCWLPFFCMTLDLVSCVPIVHRNGTLWRYVRASMALVGFLPPLCDWAPREREGAQGTDPSSPRSSMEGGALQIPSTGGNGSPPNSASTAGNAGNKSAARDRRFQLGWQEPGRLHVLVDGGVREQLSDGRDVRDGREDHRRRRRERPRVARVSDETLGRRAVGVDAHREVVAAAVARGRAVVPHDGGHAVPPAVHHGLRQRRAKVANSGRDGSARGCEHSDSRV